jgi:predicted amidohydrolase
LAVTKRLALAQYALDPEMSANLTRALELMESASRQTAELVLFPELCLSPFFPQFAGQRVSHYALALDDERIREFQTATVLPINSAPGVAGIDRPQLQFRPAPRAALKNTLAGMRATPRRPTASLS